MIERIIAWFETEGSTRPAGLLRIALAFLIWVRFADELAFYESGNLIAVVFEALFFLATACMLVGLRARLATGITAVLLGLMYFGAGHGAGVTSWTSHHIYLLLSATTLLAFAPCGASFSIDRLRAVSDAEREGRSPPPERASLIVMRLIALQVVAVYFWSAVDKTTLSWISGERLQQVFWWQYSGRLLFGALTNDYVTIILSVAVLVIEYLIALAILIRRFQPVAIPVAMILHVMLYLFVPVMTFSGTMILLYLAVIDADDTNRVIERLMGRSQSGDSSEAAVPSTGNQVRNTASVATQSA